MKTSQWFYLLTAMAIAWTAGCSKRNDAAATGGDDAKKRPVVALVVKTLNHPFFIDMQHGAEAAAKAAGVELIVQAADREIDVERQMQIIENLIQRKVSALVVAPSGSREIVPVIVKANRAGIPVVIVDTRVDAPALAAAGGKTATFVGSDNYEGGKLAGEFLVQKSGGRGRVAVLEGIAGHETGDQRLSGFRDALKQSHGLQIVASQPANWERDQGFNVFQNIMQANPRIDALFAANDLMALGAVEAIAAAGKAGEITVIGFDALEEARAAVQRGAMAATIAQDPAAMGRIGVENAVRVLRGETVPAEVSVPIRLVK